MFVGLSIFRINWKKRRKCLDKVTKYAGLLAIDFRAQKKFAQSWAFKLEALKAEGERKAATEGKVAQGKVKPADVNRIAALIRELDSFASAVNTFLVFFMRIKTIIDDMKKDYESARRLRKKAGLLYKQLGEKKRVLKSKHKIRKQLYQSELRNLELEYKVIEEDFKYAKSEYELATQAYSHYKGQFKKENKAIKALIKELKERMAGYRALMNKMGEDGRFARFYEDAYSKETRRNLSKFSKWLAWYRWYY